MNHVPVLLAETLAILAPKQGDAILDVTLGLGGHSEALLKAVGSTGLLVALDADTENIELAKKRLERRAPHLSTNITIIHANFSQLPDCLPKEKRVFDCILADLGLSSPHIDDPKRGFTFRTNSPLDMRFDRTEGMTAAMLLASLDEEKLLKIFWEYGELPKVRQLVDKIIQRRKENPVRTSSDLVDTATAIYGYKAPRMLPQIFQALRIAVNGEMEALSRFLAIAPSLLAPGGRLLVISYHSLEDSAVKSSFRSLTANTKDPLTGSVLRESEYVLLTRKAVSPGEDEMRNNPRSRSARLRAIGRRPE